MLKSRPGPNTKIRGTTLAGDELMLAQGSNSLRLGAPRPSRGAPPAGGGGGAAAPEAAAGNAPPPTVILEPAAFESFIAGGRFMESHADLFRHPLATNQTGHTPEDIRDVIKSGALAQVLSFTTAWWSRNQAKQSVCLELCSAAAEPQLLNANASPPSQGSCLCLSSRPRMRKRSRRAASTASPFSSCRRAARRMSDGCVLG